jgi:hypothetical protein
MRWEYTTVMVAAQGFFIGGRLDGQKLTDHLNVLGDEGWELVSVFDTNMMQGMTRDVVAVMKRARR